MKDTISKILKMDLTKDYGFPVTYETEDHDILSFNVFTSAQFRQIVKQMFGMRLYNDWEEDTELADLITDFQNSFEQWKAIRQDTYGRRMYALALKFNPLENYNGHEEKKGEFIHGENVELSFTNRKEKTTDDTTIERTYTDFKETTTDDSTIERTYTDYKETTKDDSYVEHINLNYKETTKDDSFIEHSWGNNYTETYGHGQQTKTTNVSADDSAQFAPRSQEIDSAYDDTKEIEGTTKEQHGQTTNGLTKEITGSTKDQNGFTDGLIRETSGSYKDEHGYTEGLIRETSGSYKDEHGYTDGLIREQLGKENTAHSGKDQDNYTIDKYGNLGVTTSQQMLASDLDLLRYDITMIAIKEFISQYTYMSSEVD